MPTALLVVAHPRADSITSRIAERARRRLEKEFTVDLLGLYAEDFDPRLTPADEPEWGNRDKRYSTDVHDHMRRLEAADVIVAVFPVWWYGLPAILKGWIDRVFNYGFAYGGRTSRLSGKRMLWLGLAGESAPAYREHGLDDMLRRQLEIGISRFCGIDDAAVRFVHDSVPADPTPAAIESLVTEADDLLAGFLGPA